MGKTKKVSLPCLLISRARTSAVLRADRKWVVETHDAARRDHRGSGGGWGWQGREASLDEEGAGREVLLVNRVYCKRFLK